MIDLVLYERLTRLLKGGLKFRLGSKIFTQYFIY